MFLVNINRKAITVILSALFILMSLHSFMSVQASEDNESRSNPPEAQFTTNGVEGCLACHQGDHLTLMAKTVHGNSENPYTPYATHGCESCHGPGSLHSSRARGGVGFPALITFHRGQESRQVQNQACISCHEKDMGELKGMKWKGSLHEMKGMTCNFCHQLHVASNSMKDQQLQKDQCSKCHSSKMETHPKFASSGIEFERLPCSTCHDVHQF
ncbi:MAG: cytochrome c3 family protein [Pseudomonadales bacterium]